MTQATMHREAKNPPRIRAVAYYYQSTKDPFVLSVGQQRQMIRDWAAEHDIEIIREFSQVGYSRSRQCALDEMLCQWSAAPNEMLYVLALRMRRRSEGQLPGHERGSGVTIANLNTAGTIRLAYLDLVNGRDLPHPQATREMLCDASLAIHI